MKAENRQYYKLGTDKKELPEFWCKHQNRSGDCSPFGLTMAGISSKAANINENKTKYQQYELNTDFDINLYESFYRSHDPQLGRFWQVDPKPNEFESPYAAMGNNPIRNSDFLGDTVWTAIGGVNYYYQPNADKSRGSLINSTDGSAYSGNTAWHNELVTSMDELYHSPDEELASRSKEVVESSFQHFVNQAAPGFNMIDAVGFMERGENRTTVDWDGTWTYNQKENKIDRPTEKLAHELLGHSYQAMKGTFDPRILSDLNAVGWVKPDGANEMFSSSTVKGLPVTEVDATRMQNKWNILRGHKQAEYYQYPVVKRNGKIAQWSKDKDPNQGTIYFLFRIKL
jgi:RHS repeat-associated protein